MENLTIKRQMIIASMVAIILFIVTNFYVYEKNATVHKVEAQQKVAIINQFNLKNARYHIVQIQQFLTDASLTGSAESVDEALDNRNEALKISRNVKQTDPQFGTQINELITLTNKLYDTGIAMNNAYQTLGTEAGNKIMSAPNTGFDARSAALADKFNKLVVHVNKKAVRLTTQLKNSQQSLQTVNLVASFVQLSIIILLCAIVFMRILPAINRLNANIINLVSGDKDLSQRLVVGRKDELGKIAQSINFFTNELDTMIAAIVQANIRLQKITSSFKTNASDASNGMQEVHNHTDLLATAITEMASTVAEVARNTEHAAEIANTTRDTTLMGEKVVSDSIDIINTLASDINESATQIQSLVDHSEKIGNIINVIKSISDQTNLLALNAAIEAARAGDAGRGFAVVADEVRSLAKNTQDSAAEIENMIDQIQQESQQVSASMHNNIDKAATTVEKAQLAGNSLKEIAQSVMELADVNIQIATASEQQSTVSEEINKSILQVANIAGETLNITNKVGLASLESVFSAAEVSDLVNQFKITAFEVENSDKLVNWSNAYSVHVPSIDQQHRKLFDLMNDVYQLIISNKLDDLSTTLDQLVEFAKKHLYDEEQILQRVNYENFNAHKKIHTKLLADLDALYKQAGNGDFQKLFELVMFLKNWLVDHIYRVDMKYSNHLVSMGVK